MIGKLQDPLAKERERRKQQRSWAIALALIAFIAVIYVVTMAKIGGW